MLKELEKYIIPDNYTGNRLKIACEELIYNWTALNLAFDNNTMTINETKENMTKLFAYQLGAYIYNCETTIDDIVEFFSIYLEQYFQLVIQDNSDIYIATRILEVFNDLENENDLQYNKLLADIEVFKKQQQKVKHVINNIASSDSESEDDEEVPQLQQQQQQQQFQQMEEENDVDEDEDGFIIVQHKRRYKHH